MVLQGPPVERQAVSVITPHFQIAGHLETIGVPFSFINDAGRDSLSLYDAYLTPLTPGGPLKGFLRPHIVIRRSEIVLLHFASAETRASVRTRRRKELLVAYTPVAVCRGYFHMADEASLNDFLDDVTTVLLPITETKVFPLVELPAPFPTEADLLLVGLSHLQFYHPA
ncbi:MAG: hypothetical protein ACE5OS_12475 [Anaerolineae bacterium]